MDKQVVISHESNLQTGGRKSRQPLAATFRQRFDFFIFKIEKIIIGSERTAVNRFLIGTNQYPAFICIEGIIVDPADRRILQCFQIQ